MLPHGLPPCAAYRLQPATAHDNSHCWPALQTTPLPASGRQVHKKYVFSNRILFGSSSPLLVFGAIFDISVAAGDTESSSKLKSDKIY